MTSITRSPRGPGRAPGVCNVTGDDHEVAWSNAVRRRARSCSCFRECRAIARMRIGPGADFFPFRGLQSHASFSNRAASSIDSSPFNRASPPGVLELLKSVEETVHTSPAKVGPGRCECAGCGDRARTCIRIRASGLHQFLRPPLAPARRGSASRPRDSCHHGTCRFGITRQSFRVGMYVEYRHGDSFSERYGP